MAYVSKYEFRFENAHGRTYKVRLLENGYSGDVTRRPLGASPVIRMQESGAFRPTSCELTLECQVDGEFAFLYTSDPQQYKIEVYDNTDLVWQGFVATELYSEPSIAPPYDVKVTATDGLGVLKEYDFVPAGLRSIRSHLKDFLLKTGIYTGIYCISSLKVHGDTVENFFDEVEINLDYHAGHSVYEALEDLLKTMRCFVTQWRGEWLIIRETDVSVDNDGWVPCYCCPVTPTTPTYSTSLNYMTATVGQMGVAHMWPVGFLTRTVRPAKKSVKVKAEWHPKSGFPPTSDDSGTGWVGQGDYSHASGYSTWEFGVLGGVGGMFASVGINDFRDDIKVTIKVAHNHVWTNWNGKPYIAVSAQFQKGNDMYYYHPDSGWTTSSPATYDEHPVEKTNRSYDPNGWDEYTLTLPSMNTSNDGILYIVIAGHLVTVAGVEVVMDTVRGYEDTIVIDNGARGVGEDLSISGGREVSGYVIDQYWADGVFVLSVYQTIIMSFDDADNSDLDFLSLEALNYAKVHAAPRIETTGTIDFPANRFYQPLIILNGGVLSLMESYDWDLKEAEINFKAVTIPAATLTVDSETITSLPE